MNRPAHYYKPPDTHTLYTSRTSEEETKRQAQDWFTALSTDEQVVIYNTAEWLCKAMEERSLRKNGKKANFSYQSALVLLYRLDAWLSAYRGMTVYQYVNPIGDHDE